MLWTNVLSAIVLSDVASSGLFVVASCQDSATWARALKNGKEKSCGWVNAKPEPRCSRRGNVLFDKRLASEACPLACGKCTPTPCQNNHKWSWENRNGQPKDCSWVAKRPSVRCHFLGFDNGAGLDTWAYEGCPESCGRCPAEYSYDHNVPENQACSNQGSLIGPNIELSTGSLAARKLSFFAMGDAPYDANVGSVPYEGAEYSCLRDVILPRISEASTHADFMVHIGDIWKGNNKGGLPYCNSRMLESRRSLFQAVEPHLDFFAVPGDNEWNECANFEGQHNASSQSAEELWRQSFAYDGISPFAQFDRSSALPSSNRMPPSVERHLPHYPENFFFSYLDVAFLGILQPMGFHATDPHTQFSAFNGDINAKWISTKLASSPVSAIVIFGHAKFSSEVRSVLQEQEAPILYVMGNTHPDHYCLQRDDSLPNLLELTVEPFKAGPLLVTIVTDHFGNHRFHVNATAGC